MNGFLDNAAKVFEAAENVLEAGETPSDYTIVFSAAGGMHMIADSDWPLDSVQREYGGMAYRVKPSVGRVNIDGSDGMRSCHLEMPSPQLAAQMLLNAFPRTYI